MVEAIWVTSNVDHDGVFAAKVGGEAYNIKIEHSLLAPRREFSSAGPASREKVLDKCRPFHEPSRRADTSVDICGPGIMPTFIAAASRQLLRTVQCTADSPGGNRTIPGAAQARAHDLSSRNFRPSVAMQPNLQASRWTRVQVRGHLLKANLSPKDADKTLN
jgi:hypothetical protein